MVDAVTEKRKLLNRVRRLRGQIEAIERALGVDAGCIQIMQLLTAARGAITGLMAEVVEDHIRIHMIDAKRVPTASETRAADELVGVLRSYIR
jgi:DNA-binding FrmR family transcriptional regulator